MNTNWFDDLLELLTNRVATEEEIRAAVDKAVHALGFEYYHFVYRQVLPFSQARMRSISNYPLLWRKHYAERGYASIDPRVSHGMNSEELLAWNDQLFHEAPELWRDMKNHGFVHGLTQSTLNGVMGLGILSLARSSLEIESDEIAEKGEKFTQLTQLIHSLFSRRYLDDAVSSLPGLSPREAEVMRWTADGKSARDIAEILHLSKNTIDFHIKNTVSKLGAPNKTAAVILAASLGII